MQYRSQIAALLSRVARAVSEQPMLGSRVDLDELTLRPPAKAEGARLSLRHLLLALLSRSTLLYLLDYSVYVSSKPLPRFHCSSSLYCLNRLRHLKTLFATPVLYAYSGPTVPTAINSRRTLSTMSGSEQAIFANGW
jgi:hypothetical protein